MHQCPKCELLFERKTELDDHCWHDHPEFRHEYPAQAPPPLPHAEAASPHADPEAPTHIDLPSGLMRWLIPAHRAGGVSVPHEPEEPVAETEG